MKTLFAIRHAEAESGYQSDFDRMLTSHGASQTEGTARFIGSTQNNKTIFVHSSAKRTTQTCQLIHNHLKSTAPIAAKEELYNSPLKNYLQVLEQLSNDYDTVILVGHNPTISQLISFLTNELKGYLSPSGGAKIQLNCSNWNEISTYATLLDYYEPTSF